MISDNLQLFSKVVVENKSFNVLFLIRFGIIYIQAADNNSACT